MPEAGAAEAAARSVGNAFGADGFHSVVGSDVPGDPHEESSADQEGCTLLDRSLLAQLGDIGNVLPGALDGTPQGGKTEREFSHVGQQNSVEGESTPDARKMLVQVEVSFVPSNTAPSTATTFAGRSSAAEGDSPTNSRATSFPSMYR